MRDASLRLDDLDLTTVRGRAAAWKRIESFRADTHALIAEHDQAQDLGDAIIVSEETIALRIADRLDAVAAAERAVELAAADNGS